MVASGRPAMDHSQATPGPRLHLRRNFSVPDVWQERDLPDAYAGGTRAAARLTWQFGGLSEILTSSGRIGVLRFGILSEQTAGLGTEQ